MAILVVATFLPGFAVAQVFIASDGLSIGSCSGIFYDTGGPSGNYGDNEDITVTICPAGGAGAGPFTSVTFLSFDVQLLALSDQLVIHNGTSTADPVLATGGFLNNLTGQSFVATGPSGCLTFHWTSDLLINSAGWSAAITTGPSAGTNGSTTACSSGASFGLTPLLGGTPDVGGSWTAPGGASHGATFDPLIDPAGVWTYTVSGPAPCPDSSATVTVTLVDPPNAGTNGSADVCSNGPLFDLFSELGGSPDPGGAWTLGGSPVSNTFTPGTSVAGTYTYTVNGIPPCPNDLATVVVSQATAPDAGINSSISACSDEPSFPLIAELLGSPDVGGSWSGPSPVIGGQFNPATMNGGNYVYTVSGAPPCSNASATLSITLRQAPDAGTNGTITVCSTDATFQLIGVLGGSPDVGGSWTGPGGSFSNGSFDPGVSTAGTYVYTVAGQPPCADDVATVIVTVNNAPNAGTNASTTVCSDAPNVNMFTLLGAGAQTGGSWVGPAGPHTGNFFDPGTNTPGTYTYTVAGTVPCANASATVNVTVIQAPNAGSNVGTTVCSTDGSFSLFALLGGSPDGGGTWTRPGGGANNGTYVPGTDPEGIYTYTVLGTAPCANDLATVTVNENTAPDAGSNGALTICSNALPQGLFVLLGGTPDPGGTWTKPNGTAFGGTYDPANVDHPAGVYTYTILGVAPCANASATVLVTENPAPNAGIDASVTRCSTQGPFNLFGSLTGNPNPTGFWLNPSNAPFTNPFIPGTSVPGEYTYVVTGTAPCVNDSATVMVTVNTAPDAGLNGTLGICSSDTPVALIGSLGGTPDAGGSWSGPSPVVGGGYDPATMLPGNYIYTVVGTSPCVNATATVTVSESQQPDAGGNGMEQVCSTASPFSLFSELTGSPDPGGVWSGPSPTTGTYAPASMVGGVYTYTVAGVAPCANDQASVTVIENAAPYAGGDGTITICEDAPVVNLFGGLVGNYDPGGTWSDDDGTGQLNGSLFDPFGIAPGTYQFTYLVQDGGGPCGDDSARVVVEIVNQLDAGTNGTIAACGNNASVDLFGALGGTPQAGGVWIPLNGGTVNGSAFDASSVAPGSYQFRYRITGTLGCASDSATATVNVVGASNAGVDVITSICSNATPFNMFPLLGPTAQSDGTWSYLGPHSNFYNPASDVSGVYTYTKPGSAPCLADIATVTITEVPAPVAGGSNAIDVCANSGALNMTDSLLGSPSATGTWTNPFGQAHNATFVPGFDGEGVWTYTVTGTPPCQNGVATLSIEVNDPPNAGSPAQVTVCSSTPFVILNNVLQGEQAGGSWTNPGGFPHTGIYDPDLDGPGDYTYTVIGIAPCAPESSTVTVFEIQEADAGTSGSITLCEDGGNVNLFTVLGGTPDATGFWTFPGCGGPPHSGIFNPGTSLEGTYCYHVNGTTPCANAQASVTVAVNAPANAGCNNSIVVCSTNGPFALFDSLGCSPDGSGDWTFSGTTHSGTFFPGISTPGIYTYLQNGDAPCPDAIATVSVTVIGAAYAGENGSVMLCSSAALTNLFLHLGGGPQTGGTWTDPDGDGHSGFFNPGSDQEGVYTYTVNGQFPCTTDQATVSVTVNDLPDAGANGTHTVCDNGGQFLLISFLNGTPDPGGDWLDPVLAPHGAFYAPGISEPGIYTYVVDGDAPCPNASATVTVFENDQPDAGNSNVVSLCSDAQVFQLIDTLLGTPDTDGSWTDPSSLPFSGSYQPGSSAPGVYTYTVLGDAPCTNDVATVTISETAASDAGFSSSAELCSDAPSVDMVTLLAGTPDNNGSWVRVGDGPHGNFFDPATEASGTFVYTVSGLGPCTSDVASLQITVVPEALAGGSGIRTACINDPAIDLFTALQPPFDGNGTWTNGLGAGVLTANVWNASGVAPGNYPFSYTVLGSGPCADAVTTITITITSALDAGNNASIQVCESETVVDLFAALGGTPQPGGTWQDNGSSGQLFGGYFNASGVLEGTTWQFTYILSASAACLRDSAIVTVEVLDGPDAGQDASPQYCSTQSAQPLGVPIGGDAGGTWFDPLFNTIPASFDPGNDLPGNYTYVLAAVGNCLSDSAVFTIGVTQAPDAGVSGSLAICSDGDPVPLISGLGGTPDATGSWNDPDGIYSPASQNPGVFIYTVPGQFPCAAALVTVTVTESAAPVAGGDNTILVCSDDALINMTSALLGAQGNGSWLGPTSLAHGPNFNPAMDLEGVYTYVVTGTAPCVNDTAELEIQLTIAADAGNGLTINACVTETCVDLFASLGGAPDTTGTWEDLDGTSALFGDCFNATLVLPGTYQFQYMVTGSGPCADDSTTVTVNVGVGASAGGDSSVTVCGSDTAYVLFDALTGSPAPGGVWTDINGSGALLPDGILNVSDLPIGGATPFVYTIDVGCGEVSATVLVTASPFPVAGRGTDLIICSTADPIDLFALLTGGPQSSGSWAGPGGPHSATFDPSADAPGEYIYTVDGGAFCPDATATIDIIVNDPPNAGTNGIVLTCDTVVALDLFTGLLGAPQSGGTWVDIDGAGGLTGGVLNTTGVPPGEYDFSYTVNVPGCGSASALVKVEVVTSVDVIDVVRTCNDTDRTYVVTFIIEQGDPDTYQVIGLEGSISTGPVYTFTSVPIFTSNGFAAFVQDQYACSVVPVVGGTPCDFQNEVFIPETFSPNGDGTNETFLIPGIEGYPNNTLVIFNRWGGEVYDAAGYNNSSVVWDGTSPSAALAGPAPAGTYFYILDLGNGAEALTGYVYLNR